MNYKAITFSVFTVTPATGTLTSNNTNVSDGDTVTIGNKTYTFKNTIGTTEGNVKIDGGGSADASLLNLISAVNHTGTPNTDYYCAAAHTQVSAASSVVSHHVVFTALTATPLGADIAVAKSAATLTWTSTDPTFSASGTIASTTPYVPGQRVTVQDYQTKNPNWFRGNRLTDDGFFSFYGPATYNAILAKDSWSKIARAVEPTLTWPPTFATNPADTTVAAAGAAHLTVLLDYVAEGTAATYQWQVSADSGATWASATGGVYSTDTTTTLTITAPSGKNGYQYRCKATYPDGPLVAYSTAATLTVT